MTNTRPETLEISPPSAGQMVVVVARWILVLAGLVVAVWLPGSVNELRVTIAVVFTAALANFYLHTQLLRRQPTLGGLAEIASLADIALIAVLILSQGGFRSGLYVFYFPALAAMALAFPSVTVAGLGVLAMGTYTAVALLTLPFGNAGSGLMVLLTRLAMMAAVTVVGATFSEVQQRRAAERGVDQPAHYSLEDLFFGQVATVWARWFVVLTGVVLTLWRSATATDLVIGILPLVVLMAVNCYLHARVLMEQPANGRLLGLVCGVDVLAIGTVVLTWGPGHGYTSPYFVLAYPVLFGMALVFPPARGRAVLASALLGYGLLCVLSGTLADASQLKDLVLRLITLGSVGGLGIYYWRVLRAAPHRASRVAASFSTASQPQPAS